MAASAGRFVSAFGSATRITNLVFNKPCLEHFPALSLWRIGGPHGFSACPVASGGIMEEGLSKSACIDPTVVVEIGALGHSKSVVESHVHIGSGAVIGLSVSIGQSTKIGYKVTLCSCTIDDLCVVHNGVCIGQDGSGFIGDKHGNVLKKPQIGNHVEIGANTCVDRGSWRDTVIGDHSKIDNLVQDQRRNCCVTKDITEPGYYGGCPVGGCGHCELDINFSNSRVAKTNSNALSDIKEKESKDL